MSRKIGPRATACIKYFESCRLSAYRCSAGKATIGWGNTFYADGRPVRMGDRITQPDADALFAAVVRQFEAGVEAALAGAPATPAQYGALVSFAWNLGVGALEKSTLLKLHKTGQIQAASNQFPRWNKSSGRVTHGLVRRRAVERRLYLDQLAVFDRALELYGKGAAVAADKLLGIARA